MRSSDSYWLFKPEAPELFSAVARLLSFFIISLPVRATKQVDLKLILSYLDSLLNI